MASPSSSVPAIALDSEAAALDAEELRAYADRLEQRPARPRLAGGTAPRRGGRSTTPSLTPSRPKGRPAAPPTRGRQPLPARWPTSSTPLAAPSRTPMSTRRSRRSPTARSATRPGPCSISTPTPKPLPVTAASPSALRVRGQAADARRRAPIDLHGGRGFVLGVGGQPGGAGGALAGGAGSRRAGRGAHRGGAGGHRRGRRRHHRRPGRDPGDRTGCHPPAGTQVPAPPARPPPRRFRRYPNRSAGRRGRRKSTPGPAPPPWRHTPPGCGRPAPSSPQSPPNSAATPTPSTRTGTTVGSSAPAPTSHDWLTGMTTPRATPAMWRPLPRLRGPCP